MAVAGGCTPPPGEVPAACSTELQYHVDPESRLSLAEGADDERDWNSARGILTLGTRPAASVYLRLRTGAADELLEVAYPPLDYIDLYLVDEDAPVDQRVHHVGSAGDRLPFGAAGLQHRNFVFPLTPGDRCLLLRVRSESALVLPIYLHGRVDFHRESDTEHLLLGLNDGALSIMLVYNAFLAVSLRNASYAYYVFYIFCYGTYLFIWNGLALRFFWPDTPHLNSLTNPLFVGLTNVAAPLFTISFFRDSSHARVLHHVLRGLMFSGALIAILSLTPWSSLAVRISVPITLLSAVFVLLTAARHFTAGYPPARYFLLAFSFVGVGVTANALRVAGFLPANFFTLLYGLQITSLAEMVLLSFALADRYRVTEDDRRVAQAESNAKTMFIARMSHEIRTPLNAVLGASKLLEETILDAEQRRYVHMLNTGGRSLLGVVNDVLDLVKIESGHLELAERSFDFSRLIRDCVNLHEAEAQRKGIDLRCVFDDEGNMPRYLYGDDLRLSRVLINLLHNALKFTEDGHIVLTAKTAPVPDGRYRVDIEVRDTGVGIDPSRLDRIFAEFSQADESITRRFGGTGLGLAICRGILNAMHGTIRAESEGRGSTFFVALTLRAGETPQDVVQVSDDGPVQAALRILLVEDNADNRALFTAFLKRAPHNIAVAENGLEALSAFDRERFDVIFMDMQMPLMDGLTATKRIRQIEAEQKLRPTPIYALTAHAYREERERCLDAGCDGHIAKPVPKERLLAVLAHIAAQTGERR